MGEIYDLWRDDIKKRLLYLPQEFPLKKPSDQLRALYFPLIKINDDDIPFQDNNDTTQYLNSEQCRNFRTIYGG
jgi:hypothetical protein